MSKKLNFEADKIELKKQWIQYGKQCYLFSVITREDGEQTSYAYPINSDLQFIFWGISNTIE
ncbi:MAG TPA: hypothetical protein VKI61_01595 [Chitinophagaceae bacterium]|nr:hypothetical protein [Chitinophagaceae bacterium]